MINTFEAAQCIQTLHKSDLINGVTSLSSSVSHCAADYSVEHQPPLFWSCFPLSGHWDTPVPHGDRLKSGLGKCWAAHCHLWKMETPRRGGQKKKGGSHTVKKSGTCWLPGVFLHFWLAEPSSIICMSFLSRFVTHTDPTPWAWDIWGWQEQHGSGG